MLNSQRWIAFALMGVLMSACVPPVPDRAPTPTARPTPVSGLVFTQSNTGAICFSSYDTVKQTLSGATYAFGCFWNDCYDVIESRVSASLDTRAKALRFANYFEFSDLRFGGGLAHVCGSECVPGGKTIFTVTSVLAGARYDVFLGEEKLGDFQMPTTPTTAGLDICLGASR